MSGFGIRRFSFRGEENLVLTASRENFKTLQDWIGEIARELSVPENVQYQIFAAADEIFTNITDYAYPPESGNANEPRVCIAVEFHENENRLVLSFSDTGIAFDPLQTPRPELDKPLQERSAGGLGIFLVRQFMDSVRYRREGDRNILVFSKKLPQGKNSAGEVEVSLRNQGHDLQQPGTGE